jgi:hypothetical protein
MSELQKIKHKYDLLIHLHELFNLQGFIALEQLNEHREALTVEKYQDWYEYLDSASLIKLVTESYLPNVEPYSVKNSCYDQTLIHKIVPILLKRLEQQQTEIKSLKQQLSETSKKLRLIKKSFGIKEIKTMELL